MRRPVVVADSGPLIALAICSQLRLLSAVFDGIHIPQVVLDETTNDRARRGASDILAFALKHGNIHPNRTDETYATLAGFLDEGEAQALSLARALGCGMLMDERRGRMAAIRQGPALPAQIFSVSSPRHPAGSSHCASRF